MAMRFVVEVEGERVSLTRADSVDMPAPGQPGDPRDAQGLYAELRGEGDEPLYRHDLSSQLDPGVEVFAPDGSARRTDEGGRKKTLMFVVPDDDRARELVFLRAPERGHFKVSTQAVEEPLELARFSLPGASR
jgi:hypothetical protein